MEPWQEGCIVMRILQSFCIGWDLLLEKSAFQTCILVWQCILQGTARGYTQLCVQLYTHSYIKDCSYIQLSLLLLQPTFYSLITTISSSIQSFSIMPLALQQQDIKIVILCFNMIFYFRNLTYTLILTIDYSYREEVQSY